MLGLTTVIPFGLLTVVCGSLGENRTSRQSIQSRVPDGMASKGVDLVQEESYRRATNLWMKSVDLVMD